MLKGGTGRRRGGGSPRWPRDLRRVVRLLAAGRLFWEYVWAVFPKAIFWPAYMVYEGFRALGA